MMPLVGRSGTVISLCLDRCIAIGLNNFVIENALLERNAGFDIIQ